jgi:hypothetical protein
LIFITGTIASITLNLQIINAFQLAVIGAGYALDTISYDGTGITNKDTVSAQDA